VGRACLATPLHSTPRCGQCLSAPQQIAGVRKSNSRYVAGASCGPYSCDSLLHWVGLRRRSVAKHALQRSTCILAFLLIRTSLCISNVRKGREGWAESLSHLLRWSCQKRYKLVAQPPRLNMLPRNFCVTYRFWKRNRTETLPCRCGKNAAQASLPFPHHNVCLEEPIFLHIEG